MMKNRGMTLFIAVVVMSILLFISFAVVNIAIKGSLFSSSGRDSQYAFFAADAGLECAEYWDSKFDAFSTTTPNPMNPSGIISCVSGVDISTDSQSVPTYPSQSSIIGGDAAKNNAVQANTSIFYFVMNQGINPVNSCAVVTVRKYYSGADLKTEIRSKGYNTCDTSYNRRMERGVEITY
jgi:Tfp pilus assembly protein PilX